jgi:hypothetical protein
MKTRKLSIEEMEELEGGGISIEKACASLAIGSVVYAYGLITNWWNPVGWISASLLVGDAACAVYLFN